MRKKMSMAAAILVFLAMIGAGCSSLFTSTPAGNQTGSGNAPMIPYYTPTPGSGFLTPSGKSSGTPQSHPMIPYTGTSDPSTGSNISSGLTTGGTINSTVSVTPLTPDSSGSLTITPDNNGRTVLMKAGQSFVLELGDIYNWTIAIDNQNIISREVNIMPLRGSQGVFDAHQAGTTTLQASGDPLCRQSQPACMSPSVIFTITITVK